MQTTSSTIPEVTHHRVALNGTNLHSVSAGSTGSPILLVQGWPETWWVFHKVIPILAQAHRVVAVDLRGFGDSDIAQTVDSSASMAKNLHALIGHLGLGPVHLAAQDFSGPLAYGLAATHPHDLLSFTAVETGLPGFGLEILTNPMVAWYDGPLARQGAAERFFKARETELLTEFIFIPPTTNSTAIGADDIAEFIRGYARDGGWNGAQAIYNSNLCEIEENKALVAAHPLIMPMLAIDQNGSNFTSQAFAPASAGMLQARTIESTGHSIAMEAPVARASTLLEFADGIDQASQRKGPTRAGPSKHLPSSPATEATAQILAICAGSLAVKPRAVWFGAGWRYGTGRPWRRNRAIASGHDGTTALC